MAVQINKETNMHIQTSEQNTQNTQHSHSRDIMSPWMRQRSWYQKHNVPLFTVTAVANNHYCC